MTKFFLSSHGHLASGMSSALDILLGMHERMIYFDLQELRNQFPGFFYPQ